MSKVSTRPQQAATPPVDAESIHNPHGGRPARQDPQSPSATSPTLITLQVRSRQQYFDGSLPDTFRSAGFGNSKVFIAPALVTFDTGDTIAEPKWDGWLAAMGELNQIDVRCDPARCAIEAGAGDRLIRATRALADELDGFIADGTGRELSEEEQDALGQYIEVVLDQRAADAAPKGVQIDANTKRFPEALSFQYRDVIKPHGRKSAQTEFSYFPAFAGSYYAGSIEGTLRAIELIEFCNSHHTRSPSFKQMLEEIYASGQLANTRWNDGTCHAAQAFLEVVEQVFRAGCANISKGWLIGRLQRLERGNVEWEEHRAATKADFVERMRAAKASKKAEREGGAA